MPLLLPVTLGIRAGVLEGVVVGVERVKYLFWLWLRGLLNAGCVVGAAAHVEVGEL